MKKIFFLGILISCIQLSKAQSQSNVTETLNSSEVKSTLISKGRVLLLDEFLVGNTTKVIELEDYLNKQSNEDYLALYLVEQWLIDYWTKDFSSIIRSTIKYDSLVSSMKTKVCPEEDYLFLKLRQKLYLQKRTIVQSINESNLVQSEKDFLIMHLYSCLITKDTNDITQDTLNFLADDYLINYPENLNIGFVRKHIRYKLLPSNWGYAMEFFSGYGLFSGDLSTHYGNNVPIGVAFDVSYKNVILYLRDYIGFSYTKHDFNDHGVLWPKNSQVRVYLPELSLGYIVHDSKRIKLAPFIGLSSTDIGPTEYDQGIIPNVIDYELKFTKTYSVGLNLDFKFGKPKVAMVTQGPEESNWFIRVRYCYNFPQFSNTYNGFDGDMQYLTIGIGGFGRKLKKD